MADGAVDLRLTRGTTPVSGAQQGQNPQGTQNVTGGGEAIPVFPEVILARLLLHLAMQTLFLTHLKVLIRNFFRLLKIT